MVGAIGKDEDFVSKERVGKNDKGKADEGLVKGEKAGDLERVFSWGVGTLLVVSPKEAPRGMSVPKRVPDLASGKGATRALSVAQDPNAPKKPLAAYMIFCKVRAGSRVLNSPLMPRARTTARW
jgi:hypothetical protein